MRKSIGFVLLAVFFLLAVDGCKKSKEEGLYELLNYFNEGVRNLNENRSALYSYVSIRSSRDVGATVITWSLEICEGSTCVFEINDENHSEYPFEVAVINPGGNPTRYPNFAGGLIVIGSSTLTESGYVYTYAEGDIFNGAFPNTANWHVYMLDDNGFEHHLTASFVFQFPPQRGELISAARGAY